MAKAVKEGKSKSEEDQRKVHWEKEASDKAASRKDGYDKSSSKKDSSDKGSLKKDQQNQNQNQNSKKGGKDQDKKKVQENGVKNANKKAAPHKAAVKNASKEKRKEKGSKGNNNNNNNNKKQLKKSVTKPSGQFFRSFIHVLLLAIVIPATVLGFLYVVDIEKYRMMCDRGVKAFNSVVSLLPVGVVTKGQEVFEFVRPVMENAVGKVQGVFRGFGAMLDANPALKDHWNNINEISSVIGARLAEYMRTVYTQLPIYYDNAKNKLF